MSSPSHQADFPIFSNTPHVYLDSAATTHKPSVVIDRILDFYSKNYGTVRRGLYHLSAAATRQFEETRNIVTRFIIAQDPSEIIFTSGATESINLVAQCYLEPILDEGDEIIISTLEHHANFIPWQQLAIQKKAHLIILPLTQSGDIDLNVYQNALSNKTKLVAITHISNVIGTINPVKEMIAMAHDFGAKVLIDGAQSIAHLQVDVQNMDCDFFVFSGHKIYGPTGIGVLFGKKEVLKNMPPYRYGGEMILEVTNEYSNFREAPQRFEPGTPNIAGVVGLGAALQYVNSLGLDKIAAHEENLTQYLIRQLNQIGCNIIGDPDQRSSLVSLLIDDIHPHDVATILDSRDIAIRAGHHCAQPLMRYLKIPATVRVSLGWYNVIEDIDQLIQGIIHARNLLK